MGNSNSNSNKAPAMKDYIDSELASHDIVVFSKSYCPYCAATKKTLGTLNGVDVKIVEMDLVDNGSAIQSSLKKMTGQRTVPNVFVKGKHVGGNDDTQAAFSTGKLQEMLK